MNSEEERTENMSGGLGKDQGIFPLGNIVQRGWNGFSSFLGTLREPENIILGNGRSDRHAKDAKSMEKTEIISHT